MAVFPRVLVPLRLDAGDRRKLDAVRTLADQGGVERVVLLHVAERERSWFGLGEAPTAERPPALDEAVLGLDAALSHVDVSGMSRAGRGVDEVVRVAQDEAVSLVVVDRSEDHDWGGYGQRILRLAGTPVLVLPEGAGLRLGSAVVGLDFSESAVRALRVATTLCAHVRAIAVTDVVSEGLSPEAREQLHEETYRHYRNELGGRVERLPPLELVEARSPADALLEAVADLTVVGSRGLTPLAAVLLGSTAERLGARCTRPLLVIR